MGDLQIPGHPSWMASSLDASLRIVSLWRLMLHPAGLLRPDGDLHPGELLLRWMAACLGQISCFRASCWRGRFPIPRGTLQAACREACADGDMQWDGPARGRGLRCKACLSRGKAAQLAQRAPWSAQPELHSQSCIPKGCIHRSCIHPRSSVAIHIGCIHQSCIHRGAASQFTKAAFTRAACTDDHAGPC